MSTNIDQNRVDKLTCGSQGLSTNGLVSVIINCYNGENYVACALDSIRSQTVTNWELIFWDNRSTDNTVAVFQRYTDRRFKYFLAEEHTNLYEARNHAIDKAAGEFIAFLDVDDWWEPDKLELQIPLFQKQDVGLVYGNYWFFDQETKCKRIGIKKPLPVGNILNALLKVNRVGILTAVIRRDVINSMTLPCDPRFHIIGDFDLFVRIAMRWKFECVRKPVATYRWHKDNETKKRLTLQAEEWDLWLKDFSTIKEVMNQPGFSDRVNSISAFKVSLLCKRRQWLEAFRVFREMSLSRAKIIVLVKIVFSLIRFVIRPGEVSV